MYVKHIFPGQIEDVHHDYIIEKSKGCMTGKMYIYKVMQQKDRS